MYECIITIPLPKKLQYVQIGVSGLRNMVSLVTVYIAGNVRLDANVSWPKRTVIIMLQTPYTYMPFSLIYFSLPPFYSTHSDMCTGRYTITWHCLSLHTCALLVMESASSSMTILSGGQGLPLCVCVVRATRIMTFMVSLKTGKQLCTTYTNNRWISLTCLPAEPGVCNVCFVCSLLSGCRHCLLGEGLDLFSDNLQGKHTSYSKHTLDPTLGIKAHTQTNYSTAAPKIFGCTKCLLLWWDDRESCHCWWQIGLWPSGHGWTDIVSWRNARWIQWLLPIVY